MTIQQSDLALFRKLDHHMITHFVGDWLVNNYVGDPQVMYVAIVLNHFYTIS